MIQNKASEKEVSVDEKLKALYELQTVYSEIDKINTLRGELPLEVQDLEDEIAGLETRIHNFEKEVEDLNTAIVNKNLAIKKSKELIAKYTEQQNNVRNSREFDSLTKEIEFQGLEIELAEKHIGQFKAEIKTKEEEIVAAKKRLEERSKDLEEKRKELNSITSETAKEEEALHAKAESISQMIEKRLLNAFQRIRKNARNGLAVVMVERDACGGCFNKIPPQRQMDIASRKKIIVCEYCGRILVDADINSEEE